jgi:hypothetical protein
LEEFLKTLRKPDESQKEELQAYEEVVAGVKAKIYSLFTASLVMKKSVEEIEQRLSRPNAKTIFCLSLTKYYNKHLREENVKTSKRGIG